MGTRKASTPPMEGVGGCVWREAMFGEIIVGYLFETAQQNNQY